MNATDVNLVVDKVSGLLEKVAGKIGVAADTVWPWLVQQQILEGVSLGAIAVISAVGTYLTTKGCLKWWSASTHRRASEDWDDADNRELKVFTYRTVYGIGTFIFTLILVVAGIEFISRGALKLFNPEYYGLMELISAAI